jgi:hypothetical protein
MCETCEMYVICAKYVIGVALGNVTPFVSSRSMPLVASLRKFVYRLVG